MNQQNNVKAKRLSRGSLLAIVTALVLIGLILLNVGVALIPRAYSNFVADSGDAFALSEKSRAFFKKLDTDVTIYYLEDPDMTYDGSYAIKFRIMLDKYAMLNNHVKVVYKSVSDTAFISKYYTAQEQATYGELPGSSLIIESAERSDVIHYMQFFQYGFPEDGIMLTYDQLMSVYNAWYSVASQYSSNDTQAAAAYADQMIAQYYGIHNFYETFSNNLTYEENLHWYADAVITASVDYVTTDMLPTTYFLTGHGETEPSEAFYETYLDGFGIRNFTLDLSTQTSIPKNAATLVLSNPQTDITDTEKQLLTGFIAAGGSLVLTTSPKAAEMPNLMALVNGYGLDMQNAVVYDDTLSYNSKQKDEESKTYPDDYLFFVPASEHTANDMASEIIHQLACYEEYSKYMSLYQSTGVQTYLTLAEEAYAKRSEQKDYELLVAGAHPITYTETAGVTVKELTATSDKGYLSTDSTPAKHVLGLSAIVTTGEAKGALIWLGYADSFAEAVAGELYAYNHGYMYAALDFAGSTATYRSSYLDIPTVSLDSSMDMPLGWMIAIAVVAVIILPVGTVVTGIVICIKRKMK